MRDDLIMNLIVALVFARNQGGVVCQNRAAPRAPVKLMSNRPETVRQNHTALEPPPVKTKLAPRALTS